MNKPRLYVFDFDGTLTTGDTFLPFLRFVFGKRHVAMAFLRFLPQLLLMRLRILNNGKVKERLCTYLFKGIDADILNQHAQQFAPQHIHLWRTTALQLLHDLHRQQAPIVIVTASLGCWVRPFVTQQLPDAHIIATEADVDSNNKWTGHFATPNCYGAEKVRRLKEDFPRLDEYYLIAYGDSRGDKQLLHIADEVHYKTL